MKVMHAGVGNVTESDVMMAAASKGMVIGFHTEVPAQVTRVAERYRTEVAVYKIIYQLLDDLKKLLSGLLEPEEFLVELGKGKVLKIFFTGKGEMAVGCRILEGKVEVGCRVRVKREGEEMGEGEISKLKLVNEDMKEIDHGNECGIRFKGKLIIEEGDVFDFYKKELRHKTL